MKKIYNTDVPEESGNLELKNIDTSLLMSTYEVFKPIMGEWQVTTNEENNMVGNIEIKLFPLMGLTLLHSLRRISLGFALTYGVAAVKISNNNI